MGYGHPTVANRANATPRIPIQLRRDADMFRIEGGWFQARSIGGPFEDVAVAASPLIELGLPRAVHLARRPMSFFERAITPSVRV